MYRLSAFQPLRMSLILAFYLSLYIPLCKAWTTTSPNLSACRRYPKPHAAFYSTLFLSSKHEEEEEDATPNPDALMTTLEDMFLQFGSRYRELVQLDSVQQSSFIPPLEEQGPPTAKDRRKARKLMAKKRESLAQAKKVEVQLQELSVDIILALGELETTTTTTTTEDLQQRLQACISVLETTTQPLTDIDRQQSIRAEAAANVRENVLYFGNNLVQQLDKPIEGVHADSVMASILREEEKEKEGVTLVTAGEEGEKEGLDILQSPMQPDSSIYDPTVAPAASGSVEANKDEDKAASSAAPILAAGNPQAELLEPPTTVINITEAMPTANSEAAAAVAKRYEQKQREARGSKSTERQTSAAPSANDILKSDVAEILNLPPKIQLEIDPVENQVSSETSSPRQPSNSGSDVDTKIPKQSAGKSDKKKKKKQQAPKPSIWAKLGIPSKKPKAKKQRVKGEKNQQSTSSSSTEKDKTSKKNNKEPIVYWSTLVKDLHTIPTIVIPTAKPTTNSNRQNTNETSVSL